MTSLVALLAAFAAAAGSPLSSTERVVEFTGACDASGAVVRDGSRFVVGDDEDNVLRMYDADRGGAPLATWDLSGAVPAEGRKRAPEMDIEAATSVGGVSLWLASHGRDARGRVRPSRLVLLATRLAEDGSLSVVGRPYGRLLDDLRAHPPLAPFSLGAAAERPPKEPGGLNIEGLTSYADGRAVLIGFRSPLAGGRALAVPLRNAVAVVEGAPPELGDPVELDLGGRGIRALSSWRASYLVAAGPTAAGRGSRLFTWTGSPSEVPREQAIDFGDLNPEAFVTFEERDAFLVLSDDGERVVDGTPCKRLKDPSRKRFRGLWISGRGAR
jgi:hypothetical protein